MPDLESFSLRLSTCKKLMYIAWLINFILAFADIYVYYTRLKKHMACWGCLFKHYMTLAITFSFLMIPLLILAIPLVYYHVSSHLRIYTTVLFLVTWLQMMLTILFTQEYQVVNDVFRLWLNGQNLEFFEINSECCGVLGYGDYTLVERRIPDSCFKDSIRKQENLYKTGCAFRSLKPPAAHVIQVVSVIVQFLLVLIIVLFLVNLHRARNNASNSAESVATASET